MTTKGPQRKGECAADEPCALSTRKDKDYVLTDLYTPSIMSHSAKTDIRSLIKRNGPNV
ncbi:hypothetical protein F511_41948 [Dorcoceras hygrometricum]|uniref:Uncharacterized protein n=1 Tax=Dorcoceras hygrometricum TaxID=472368 RepID=A0A2Z7BVW9_9LAMI|nr:hypothetical protein F511_41948 [Dorcoceras hygrometricum]